MGFWNRVGKLLVGTAKVTGKVAVGGTKLAAKGLVAAGSTAYNHREDIGHAAVAVTKAAAGTVGTVFRLPVSCLPYLNRIDVRSPWRDHRTIDAPTALAAALPVLFAVSSNAHPIAARALPGCESKFRWGLRVVSAGLADQPSFSVGYMALRRNHVCA